MTSWLGSTLKKAEALLESVDEKIKDTTAATPVKSKRDTMLEAIAEEEDDDAEMKRLQESALIEKMRREAREQQARNERLVAEAREAAAAREAAERMLLADQDTTEAEMQKIVQLRKEAAQAKEEAMAVARRLEDSREREKETAREKEAAVARVALLQSVIGVKELELENARQKMAALETRLERSRTVIESLQEHEAQHRASPAAAMDEAVRAERQATEAGNHSDAMLRAQIANLSAALAETRQEAEDNEDRANKMRSKLTEQWETAAKEASAEVAQRKAVEAEVRGLRQELRVEKDVSRGTSRKRCFVSISDVGSFPL